MKSSYIVTILILIAIGVGAYFLLRKDTASAPTLSEGKLDINQVCEGALAYMTFPSGEEADAFVADCKAGNRPEVIEQFKKDNNLGDGAAI